MKKSDWIKKFDACDKDGKQEMIDDLFRERGMKDLVTSDPSNNLKFGMAGDHWYIKPVFPYGTKKVRLVEMVRVLEETFDKIHVESDKNFEKWEQEAKKMSRQK